MDFIKSIILTFQLFSMSRDFQREATKRANKRRQKLLCEIVEVLDLVNYCKGDMGKAEKIANQYIEEGLKSGFLTSTYEKRIN